MSGGGPTANGPEYEPIVGRYFNLTVAGVVHRIYVEEAGQGIPLIYLHTAGADARQYRHILCDREITARYRVIAFDAPWHGKSNPPDGWQDADYQLTTQSYLDLVEAFRAALELDRPVLMGCSMGGRIALHLALACPDNYRAVIALEGADRLQPYYDTSWLNRPDVHGGLVAAGFVSGQVAPQSPEPFRWETLWPYMQSGPGVFQGDLYFYWQDGDFDDRSPQIDTTRCPVYLLSGEYDNSCTPERARATAARITGSSLTIMSGLGHFPMSENPELFRQHLLPVLHEIAGLSPEGLQAMTPLAITPVEFETSLSEIKAPDGLSAALEALWWQGKGAWDKAHKTVQGEPGPQAAWVHAHLHRVEGDDANAAHWYRRANQPQDNGTTDQEWRDIVTALLVAGP